MNRIGAIAGACAILVGLVASGATAATPQKRGVTCNQMYVEIEKKAAEIAEQYGGGFANNYLRCTKLGPRSRKGVGYVNGNRDPVTGEAKFIKWDQIVTRTKKGKLRSRVLDLTCTRTMDSGTGTTIELGPC